MKARPRTAQRTSSSTRCADLAAACRCGSPQPYDDCCGPYHRGAPDLPAPTAEALMRSRYTAYVLGLTDYLLTTWHANSRPGTIQASPAGLQWLGLEARSHAMIDDDHAEVEYVARSKLNGRAQRLHEVSRFVRENECWLYVDGRIR